MKARATRVFVGTATCAALAAVAPPANAEPYLVLEPGVWILPPTDDWGTSAGLGGNVVVGLGLDQDPLLVSPQLALGAWGFPGLADCDCMPLAGPPGAARTEGPTRTQSNLRATVGWSVGFAGPIEAQAYARVGLGYAADYSQRTPTGGLAIDAGFTGDYRLSRDVTLGLGAGYQGFAGFTAPFGGSVRSFHGITVSPRVGFFF